MKKELFKAIAINSPKLLDELLQNQAVTEDVGVMYETLQFAMQNNRLEMVERLLEFPVVQERLTKDANVDNNYILIWAAKNGHVTLMNKLLQISVIAQHAHAKNNFALRCALENGHLAVVQTLLRVLSVAEHAHLQNNWVLQWAIKNNHELIAKRLLELPGVKNNIHADNNWILKLATNRCPGLVEILQQLPIQNNTSDEPESDAFDSLEKMPAIYDQELKKLRKLILEKSDSDSDSDSDSEYKFELGACALNENVSELDEPGKYNHHSSAFNQRPLESVQSMSYRSNDTRLPLKFMLDVAEMSNANNDNDEHVLPATELRKKEKKPDEIFEEDALNGRNLLEEVAYSFVTNPLEKIKNLVDKGVNINFASPVTGMTALHFAALNGHTEIVELLIEKNADLKARDKSGETPLEMAIRGDNNRVVVMMLLEAQGLKSVDIENVFFTAANHGHIDLLCALLNQGFSFNINTVFTNGETLLGIFVKKRNALAISDLKEVSDSLALHLDLDQTVTAQDNQRPIVLAIKNKDIEVTRALADAGANLSIDDNFPAHLAVSHGMLEIVKLLHARGVVMDEDGSEDTPIHTAVAEGQLEILKFFKIQGLNLDVCGGKNDSMIGTPLCCAISRRSHDIVRWLLEEGGVSLNGPHYEDGQGDHSPVTAAVHHDNIRALKYLTNLGADLTVQGFLYSTPLQDAVFVFSDKSIEFLATQMLINVEEFYENLPGPGMRVMAYIIEEELDSINVLKTVKIMHNLGFDICWLDPDNDLTITHALLYVLARARCLAELHNIDLNIRNSKGETALHLAVLDKDKKVVKGLLAIAYTQKDLNIDAMDNNGDTPLHKACKLKADRIIKQLLNAGASTTVLNKEGQSPLDIYPEVKTQLEAKRKAIDTANVTSGNDIAEMKTQTEQNACKVEGDVAINTVPKQACISETNPPVLMQFCNREDNANSTTEAGSLENNPSNKRRKRE